MNIISNMSELEFKITLILIGLEKSIEDTRESFSGEKSGLKSSKSKIKGAVNDMQ